MSKCIYRCLFLARSSRALVGVGWLPPGRRRCIQGRGGRVPGYIAFRRSFTAVSPVTTTALFLLSWFLAPKLGLLGDLLRSEENELRAVTT